MSRPNQVSNWLCDRSDRYRLFLFDQTESTPVLRMHVAAIVIQRAWRRYLAATFYQYPDEIHWSLTFNSIVNYNREATGIKTFGGMIRRVSNGSVTERAMNAAFPHFCAAKIQSTVRMWLVHRFARFDHRHIYHVAACTLQRQWRLIAPQRKRRAKAALVIQRAWMRFSFRTVFMFYKSLILYERRGDPRRILQQINPTEAALLDGSFEATVRFRLGGTLFPPDVYYKIYVKRAIDLNAFAPRDYFEQNKRAAAAKEAGLKTDPTDHGQWYRRADVNSWRPVRPGILTDPETRQKVVDVVESRAPRISDPVRTLNREEAAKKKWKKRRAQWIRQLAVTSTNEHLPDLDDNGLLDWADSVSVPDALDFDTYVAEWSRTGVVEAWEDPALVDEIMDGLRT
ncbi:hypothetical protein J8273_3827 [Carpediemonas membranifera]|uniref:Uncharacterized protein n=1 Tax=Carpediemonas membranifera TaxID=201153 RepID=A0A8J6B7X0_9EUKA|nr:hypothetical protein J8273_3827 [Carpediemonas membranifera]|eukprot:KAG9394577.1 hypothetical protein J8273_3827 [Carpediemonas membranifera]